MNIAVNAAAGFGASALLVAILLSGGKSSSTPAPTISLPPDQTRFISAVEEARANFKTARNELAAGGVRTARQQAVCKATGGQSVSNWIGKVAQLTSNGDGKGVVKIELAPSLNVATWNNFMSDFGSDTLIDPTSQLFKSFSSMKKGDLVRFSGSFFQSDVDCIGEQSVTLGGSMTSPVYTMRFTSIRKL